MATPAMTPKEVRVFIGNCMRIECVATNARFIHVSERTRCEDRRLPTHPSRPRDSTAIPREDELLLLRRSPEAPRMPSAINSFCPISYADSLSPPILKLIGSVGVAFDVAGYFDGIPFTVKPTDATELSVTFGRVPDSGVRRLFCWGARSCWS